jgi:group II intron reverse transcriptase/maturase
MEKTSNAKSTLSHSPKNPIFTITKPPVRKPIRNIYGDPLPSGKILKYNAREVYRIITEKLTYNQKGKCTNAFKILSDPGTLKMAYESIKSKHGNMVQGTDSETLDGISMNWFKKTHIKLVDHKFIFRPARRVLIPKPDNSGSRPLGIGSPRDKIVQQAMRMVMEHVLNPRFLDCSYGFRPKRGCHQALEKVWSWTGVHWFLEGDIKKFFDRIDYVVLEDLIKKHFEDPELLQLYWRFVKAGYMERLVQKKKYNFVKGEMGVPQGGILSPLLSNLVLHELDKFVRRLIKERKLRYGEEKKDAINPVYRALTAKMKAKRTSSMRKMKKEGHLHFTQPERREWRTLLKQRLKVRRATPNPMYSKIDYVRYADDWLIGVWGPCRLARQLKEKIKNFLSGLKLELSEKKTLITSAITEQARFLGSNINTISAKLGIRKTVNRKDGYLIRLPEGHVRLLAPISKIVKRLVAKHFIERRRNGELRAHCPSQLTALPIKELIIRYRSVLYGYLNYFSFADNRPRLARIYWFLRESLIWAIGKKKQINRGEVLNRFGKNITLSITRKDGVEVLLDFAAPRMATRAKENKFSGYKGDRDPLSVMDWKISTLDNMGQGCANCDSQDRVEMHHVKHIKTINPKLSSFDKLLARINRKQVPLCRRCHLQVHKGSYIGRPLGHFYFIPFQGEPKWS